MKIKFSFFFVAFFCFMLAAKAQNITADLVVINAQVRTLNAQQPEAEAVAVVGNKVIAVGANAEIRRLIGANTKVVDAKQKLVLPGFNDSHVHFLDSAFQLTQVDLRSAKSPQEFAERIKNFAAKLPKGQWILGGNWDHENWTPNDLPTRELIDAVTPDNPVFVSRLDGHMALTNSLALKLANVTRETKDVPGGLIVRNATGEPTGVLKDAAMGYIYPKIPEFSFDEKLRAAAAMSDYAASLGVTSVQDVSAGTDAGVYQELLRQGKLKTRIYAVSPLPFYERWKNTGVRAAFGSAMLRVGGLKGFADGSLGSTTAWFFEPYLDDPKQSGLAGEEMPKMLENVRGADKAGLQIMIHAIGDRANDEVLKIYETIERENPGRDRRFRIEHAQHLNTDLIKRFAADKVIASMQPFHAIDDGRWAYKRLDPARLKGTYAFRLLLDTNVTLAFGTDSPVAPLNPFLGIYAAATRRTLDGKNPNGWYPEQKITIEEAVSAYTVGSAFAEFQENVKGTIAPGKLADLIVVSDNIFVINPIEIEKVKILMTIVDGRLVYESK